MRLTGSRTCCGTVTRRSARLSLTAAVPPGHFASAGRGSVKPEVLFQLMTCSSGVRKRQPSGERAKDWLMPPTSGFVVPPRAAVAHGSLYSAHSWGYDDIGLYIRPWAQGNAEHAPYVSQRRRLRQSSSWQAPRRRRVELACRALVQSTRIPDPETLRNLGKTLHPRGQRSWPLWHSLRRSCCAELLSNESLIPGTTVTLVKVTRSDKGGTERTWLQNPHWARQHSPSATLREHAEAESETDGNGNHGREPNNPRGHLVRFKLGASGVDHLDVLLGELELAGVKVVLEALLRPACTKVQIESQLSSRTGNGASPSNKVRLTSR